MTNKNFPRTDTPIDAELGRIARAARRLSRRGLRHLATSAAVTTLLAGLHASPALAAASTVECSPDQVCTPDLSALLTEGQDAQTQAADKWMPLAAYYTDAALKLDQAIKLDFLKLSATDTQLKLDFLKLDQGALKLRDEALFLKLGALKLNGDGLKLYKEVSAITDGTSALKGEALFLKLQQLETLGLKIDGLEATLGKDAEALQTEYNKLVEEFQSLTDSPPTTVG